MIDMISRQDAIDSPVKMVSEGLEWIPVYHIKELPSAELEHKSGKWIPCSERLPKKEEQSYWICLDGGGQCQCRWTNDMYGFGANEYSKWGWHIMDKPQYSKVVAWMPMPEPWKGEEK